MGTKHPSNKMIIMVKLVDISNYKSMDHSYQKFTKRCMLNKKC